jgi:hypothetical protein
MIDNKARVKCCITKAFSLKEISYFSNVYFVQEHNINTLTMWYNEDDEPPLSDLKKFQWRSTTPNSSSTSYYHIEEEQQTSTLLYMYTNMEEM